MSDDDNVLQQYYNLRAPEYEHVYQRDDPRRRAEQQAIAATMRELLAGRRVLEIACGTGYWTEVAADVARYVRAIDLSPEMLRLAREKGLPPSKVEFCRESAYALEPVSGPFDAGLANFWLSHVPKANLDGFLEGFHRKLEAGAIVFMADNVYIPGIGGKLINRPESEDTFKLRQLADGSTHQVLKNYYDRQQLQRILSPRARELRVHIGSCFWWLSYEAC